MRPILTVEFHAKDRGVEFEEENVTLHSPEELFEFVSPGGGCESIPNEVDEIRMVFMSPEHSNGQTQASPFSGSLLLTYD